MDTKNNNPYLHFNFANKEGKITSVTFTDPYRTIIAQEMKDVIPSLEIVQQMIKDGYYVAGYLSYEAAPAFNADLKVKDNNKMPLLWFGVYEKPNDSKVFNYALDFQTSAWKPNITINRYNESIDKIQDYIREEKTEQVNYTIQLESEFTGDSFSFYKQLEQAQAARYTAYLNIGDYSILSLSPELFFHMHDNQISTKPMKGTIGRGRTYEEDIKNAQYLRESKKNRVENELIVNLMKKELEKIAIPGSIAVPKQYEIEKYPTVYQMTSTITAEIASDRNIIDVFKALFPCGSITGLPKEKTMEIINELEVEPREIYCGAIGFISPTNEAIFNVPIRTVLIDNKNGKATYGVGGGITIDSTKEAEYEEVLIKAKLLDEKQKEFQLLESFGLLDGKILVLTNHLDRLKKSADYFDFKLDINAIKNALTDVANKYNQKNWKVRLLVSKNGEFSIEINEIFPIATEVRVALANEPMKKDDIFLYHKTTNRAMYEKHQENQSDVFDVLLWNENSEITEFTMGNIVVDLNGKLITPPITCGLLGGTFRSKLLQEGVIFEQVIKKNDLNNCRNIWFINSVREWIPVIINK